MPELELETEATATVEEQEQKQARKRTALKKEEESALAREINAEFEAMQNETKDVSGLMLQTENRRIRIGALLYKAKSSLKHGKYLPWLKEHCPCISHDAASDWLRIAKAADFREIESLEALKEYHKVLVRLGLKQSKKGHGAQQLHHYSAFAAITKAVGVLRQKLNEALEREPLAEWEADAIEQLKSQLEWLVELYEEL